MWKIETQTVSVCWQKQTEIIYLFTREQGGKAAFMSKSEKEREQILLFDDFPGTSKEDWKKEVEKKVSYENLVWNAEEGIEVEPLYTEAEAAEFTLGKDTLPGEFPFVRGTGKKHNGWLIAEEIGPGAAKDVARAAVAAIKGGAESLIFTPRTEIKPRSMKTLLKDIDPLGVRVNFVVREDPQKVCELFVSSCAEKGIDTQKLEGAVFFDPLSQMLEPGFPVTDKDELDENIEKITETVRYLSEAAPGYAAVSVNAAAFRDAGASIIQELAFAIAAATEYLVTLERKEVSAESVCRHMVFRFSTGSGYFAEIAKLRAARVLWAKVVEQFSPTCAESAKMRIHCNTTTFNKTIYDSHVNITRATLEAMASVIGGTDSLTVRPFDGHYRKPDEFSRRISRNIQLLLRNESHLDDVTDPGGGSYHIERLTESISRRALELFQKMEKEGGYLECAKSGFIQKEIDSERDTALSRVSRRKKYIIGTNEFPNPLEKMAGRIERPMEWENGAKGPHPYLFAYLEEARASQDFEKIRLFNEILAGETDEVLKVFLLHLSDSTKTAARASFAADFLRCGGFSVTDGAQSPGVRKGVAVALAENPLAVVICGSDDDYKQRAPKAVRKLVDADSDEQLDILVCAPPGPLSDELLTQGARNLIHDSCDMVNSLEDLLELLILREEERQ